MKLRGNIEGKKKTQKHGRKTKTYTSREKRSQNTHLLKVKSEIKARLGIEREKCTPGKKF